MGGKKSTQGVRARSKRKRKKTIKRVGRWAAGKP